MLLGHVVYDMNIVPTHWLADDRSYFFWIKTQPEKQVVLEDEHQAECCAGTVSLLNLCQHTASVPHKGKPVLRHPTPIHRYHRCTTQHRLKLVVVKCTTMFLKIREGMRWGCRKEQDKRRQTPYRCWRPGQEQEVSRDREQAGSTDYMGACLECPEVQTEELSYCNEQKQQDSGILTFSVALFKQLHNKPLYVISAATNFYMYIYINMHMNRLSESSY